MNDGFAFRRGDNLDAVAHGKVRQTGERKLLR